MNEAKRYCCFWLKKKGEWRKTWERVTFKVTVRVRKRGGRTAVPTLVLSDGVM